jgi:hypothetical protein
VAVEQLEHSDDSAFDLDGNGHHAAQTGPCRRLTTREWGRLFEIGHPFRLAGFPGASGQVCAARERHLLDRVLEPGEFRPGFVPEAAAAEHIVRRVERPDFRRGPPQLFTDHGE